MEISEKTIGLVIGFFFNFLVDVFGVNGSNVLMGWGLPRGVLRDVDTNFSRQRQSLEK